jgi:hypothetical protein
MVSETEVRNSRMTFQFARSQDSRRADYEAGVIFVNETRVSDNLMTVQFVLPEDETYLTGIILEPVTAESSVKGYPDTAELLEYEGLVATTIVGVLEEYYEYVTPAAGEEPAPAAEAPEEEVAEEAEEPTEEVLEAEEPTPAPVTVVLEEEEPAPEAEEPTGGLLALRGLGDETLDEVLEELEETFPDGVKPSDN